jgi:hypothetical protein
MLTEEVGRKGQTITELEEEKRALIRQLFQQTSAATSGYSDTIKSSASLRNQPPLPAASRFEAPVFDPK